MGYHANLLFISFQNYGRDVEKRLLAYARNHDLITQCMKLFGRWSMCFHIRVQNPQQLQSLIIKLRTKYPSIGDYEIVPVLEDLSIDTFPISKANISP